MMPWMIAPAGFLVQHVSQPLLAYLLWLTLAGSLALSVFAVLRRSRVAAVIAGVLSLFFAYMAMLSIGILVVWITLIQLLLAWRIKPAVRRPNDRQLI